MKQKTKIDYCKCHNSLKDEDEVVYSGLDTQRNVHYDGNFVWQETSIIDGVVFNCNECGKQMPPKIEKIFFR